ncbi:nitric oxide reductase activation protein NorD [Nocardia gamkensis]|uniref:nitric oxide reductase activation protein NorD n=1 Tax=Nocardia gamkensis TaxID=352869 RepID=UPI0036E3188E
MPTTLDIAATRDAVIVQALLISGRSLRPENLNKVKRHSDQTQHYFANEVLRTLHANRGIPAVARLLDKVGGSTEVSTSPEQSLVWARHGKVQPIIPAHWGILAPRLMTRTRAGLGGGAAPSVTRTQKDGEELSETERSVLDDIFDSLNVAPPGLFARIMASMLQSGRSRRNGGQAVAADAAAASQHPRVLTATTFTPRNDFVTERAGKKVVLYPEWDEAAKNYLPHWCRVLETVPSRSSCGLDAPDTDLRLRRSVAKVGLARERLRGQGSGDDIDLDRAIAAQVNLRSGLSADDEVYVAQAERRPDLSVAVLVDASGSSQQSGAGGTVFESQVEAAVALVNALESTGARTALLTFRSQGRKAVHVEVVKSFDERFGYSTLARLASIRPSGFTRLGAAVRHTTKLLDENAGTAHKLLVVLSDGLSFDQDYEGAYAAADARVALAEARKRQIGCLCLAIGFDEQTLDRSRAFHDQEFICADSWQHARHRVPGLLRAAVGRSKSRHRR